jgi:hypothetical protein
MTLIDWRKKKEKEFVFNIPWLVNVLSHVKVTKTGIGLTIGFITHSTTKYNWVSPDSPQAYNSRPNISRQLCSHCIHSNRSSGILCQHYPGCCRTPGSLPSFLGHQLTNSLTNRNIWPLDGRQRTHFLREKTLSWNGFQGNIQ